MVPAERSREVPAFAMTRPIWPTIRASAAVRPRSPNRNLLPADVPRTRRFEPCIDVLLWSIRSAGATRDRGLAPIRRRASSRWNDGMAYSVVLHRAKGSDPGGAIRPRWPAVDGHERR